MPENVTTEQMLFEIDDLIERAESLFEQAKRSRVKWAIDKSKKLLDVRRAILARLSQMSAETGECPICKIHGEKVRCMRCGKDFYWANILQFCENCTSQTKPTAGDAGEGVECEWKSFGVCMLGSDYKPEPSHCFHCGKEFVDGEERVFKVRAFHTYCPYK